jgi:DNA-binding transcriptional LysR family regulator
MRAFALVARHSSFLHAAAELHLTASAVSLQIKELELAAGMPLFDRHSKAVSLTQAGEVLLVDVQQALRALEHASQALSRLRKRATGLVTVGMVGSAKYFVPRLMARFRELHREVRLQIVVANRDGLIESLHRGQVDLAIMGMPPGALAAHGEAFAVQPLGIIAAPEHELAQARAVPPQALAGHEFILREPGSGTRAALERFAEEQGLVLPLRREMTGNDGVKQAVMANLGLAFLSLHAAALELQSGLLVTVDVVGLPLVRRWFVVEADPATSSDAARALRCYIVDHGTEGSVLARGAAADVVVGAANGPAALH